MNPLTQRTPLLSRRDMIRLGARGFGTLGLASLLQPGLLKASTPTDIHGILGRPHFKPKAKRVIYLFQSGGPSQIDLLDFKPVLRELHATELPDSVRGGQRVVPDPPGHVPEGLRRGGGPAHFPKHAPCIRIMDGRWGMLAVFSTQIRNAIDAFFVVALLVRARV